MWTPMHRAGLVLLAIAGAQALACSALYDVDALGAGAGSGGTSDGGDASALGEAGGGNDGGGQSDGGETGDAAGTDARSEADGHTDSGCPIEHGPPMVRAVTTCVDATEVTAAQYLEFLNADAGAAWAPAGCGWNTSFVPEVETAGDTYAWPPDPRDSDLPVQYVDWCDAATYCAWAGKNLCGAVQAGHTLTHAQATDPTLSQWYQACSKNGTQRYPYPGPYAANVCALGTPSTRVSGAWPVKSFPGCEGGYAGVFDMVGNVQEWIDECQGPGKLDDCSVAGDGFDVSPAGEADDCTAIWGYSRFERRVSIGFRCCARP
jgi:hypothetical protein